MTDFETRGKFNNSVRKKTYHSMELNNRAKVMAFFSLYRFPYCEKNDLSPNKVVWPSLLSFPLRKKREHGSIDYIYMN